MKNGFTLIELLVVITMVAFVTIFMLQNFSATRVYLNESIDVVLSDIRLAQTKTTSGANYGGISRCGYGIHYIDSNSYLIYVAPGPHIDNAFCSTLNRNYNDSGPVSVMDIIVETKDLFNDDLRFISSFNDIFFEPPDPRTYIGGNHNLSDPPEKIIIGEMGQSCNQSRCRNICVYPSGKIEVKEGDTC